MVKYIQTIRQLLPMNCLSVFDHFWRRSGVFTVKFEQISHNAVACPLLTLNK